MPEITLDPASIQQLVDQAVEKHILSAIETLGQDPAWLEKIEHMLNQAVVQRTLASLTTTDIASVIQKRVDENLHSVHANFLKNFTTSGISDQSTEIQLTVMDGTVVVENELTARNLQVVETAVVQDLVVKGSINTDNRSWNDLARSISEKTLAELGESWKQQLIDQVKQAITEQGIEFDHVMVNGELLIDKNSLSSSITESNLQKIGQLRDLTVKGEANIFNTVTVKNRRLGINTESPEMALSVWDEEVSVVIGKNKSKQAYIGTNRDQSLAIGVNRIPQIEIDFDGTTRIKKLQVNLHKISHDVQVPGWSGTRGDLVFNANPGPDRVFAWVCLGAHKWQSLKSAE